MDTVLLFLINFWSKIEGKLMTVEVIRTDGKLIAVLISKNVEEDFKRKFGLELAKVVIEHAGTHTSKVPEASDEKLVYALLEILDFDCIRYDCIGGITNKEIKKFLLKHKDEVLRMNIEPPSYLGLLAGVFDFFRAK